MVQTESLARELLFVFFSKKRIVIVTSLVLFSFFFIAAIVLPPVYQADGSLLVKAKEMERNPGSLEDTTLQIRDLRKEDMYSEAQILASETVAVNAATHLLATKSIAPPPDEGEAMDDATRAADLGRSILGSLSTEVLSASNVIRATLRWANPKEAQVILAAVMQEYLEQRAKLFNPQEKIGFLNDQVAGYLESWRQEQAQLLELVRELNAPDPGAEIGHNLSLRRDQQIVLGSLEDRRIELEERIATLRSLVASNRIHLFSFLQNQSIDALSDKVQQALVEKMQTDKVFRENTEVAADAEQYLKKTYDVLKEEIGTHIAHEEGQLNVVVAKIAALKSRIETLDERNIKLKQLQLELERIERASALKAFSFDTLYKRRDESMLQGLPGLMSKVVILQPATALPNPVEPKRRLLVMFGLVLGISAGLTLALLVDQFDTRIDQPSDLKNELEMPLIFSISDFATGPPRQPAASGGSGRRFVAPAGGGGRRLVAPAVGAVVLMLIAAGAWGWWTGWFATTADALGVPASWMTWLGTPAPPTDAQGVPAGRGETSAPGSAALKARTEPAVPRSLSAEPGREPRMDPPAPAVARPGPDASAEDRLALRGWLADSARWAETTVVGGTVIYVGTSMLAVDVLEQSPQEWMSWFKTLAVPVYGLPRPGTNDLDLYVGPYPDWTAASDALRGLPDALRTGARVTYGRTLGKDYGLNARSPG